MFWKKNGPPDLVSSACSSVGGPWMGDRLGTLRDVSNFFFFNFEGNKIFVFNSNKKQLFLRIKFCNFRGFFYGRIQYER